MIWNIVSDSSCDLRQCDFTSETVGFTSVPMRIHVGELEFLDTDALQVPQLLAAMAATETGSSTACPSPGDYARAFAQGEKTVCFTISGSMSGSFNAAMQGRALALEEHPEKEIRVIDSLATGPVVTILIRRAQKLMEAADSPARFGEICDELERLRSSLRTCFTLENFDNLVKNGRMPPFVGSVLQSLGVRVIADGTPQGTIHVADKVRGEKRMRRAITALMARSKDCTGLEVIIGHCRNFMGAMLLREQILKDLPVKSVEVRACRGLNSFYAMEKGLVVGY